MFEIICLAQLLTTTMHPCIRRQEPRHLPSLQQHFFCDHYTVRFISCILKELSHKWMVFVMSSVSGFTMVLAPPPAFTLTPRDCNTKMRYQRCYPSDYDLTKSTTHVFFSYTGLNSGYMLYTVSFHHQVIQPIGSSVTSQIFGRLQSNATVGSSSAFAYSSFSSSCFGMYYPSRRSMTLANEYSSTCVRCIVQKSKSLKLQKFKNQKKHSTCMTGSVRRVLHVSTNLDWPMHQLVRMTFFGCIFEVIASSFAIYSAFPRRRGILHALRRRYPAAYQDQLMARAYLRVSRTTHSGGNRHPQSSMWFLQYHFATTRGQAQVREPFTNPSVIAILRMS